MPTSDIRNFIAFAQGLADASGTIIRDAARHSNAFVSKGDDSPVTEIDRGVETELRRRIGEAFIHRMAQEDLFSGRHPLIVETGGPNIERLNDKD